MKIKYRLKAAREFAGLTQKELAETANVNQQAISRLETGVSQTSPDLLDIAIACGVDPVWLKNGKGQMVKDASIPDVEPMELNKDNLGYSTRMAIQFLSNPPEELKDVASKLVATINSMADFSTIDTTNNDTIDSRQDNEK